MSLHDSYALPPGHPFQNMTDAIFWAATSSHYDDTEAYIVPMTDNDLGVVPKTGYWRVMCVRGTQGNSGG